MMVLDPDDAQVIKESNEAGAVLVTWDRVVRQAAGGITPHEALDGALAEGKGTPEARADVSRLRSLSPAELTILAEDGNKTLDMFREHLTLNAIEAELARHLRVDKQYSWRAISRRFSKMWRAPWGANQLAGIVICEKAAKVTGEDFMEAPWN